RQIPSHECVPVEQVAEIPHSQTCATGSQVAPVDHASQYAAQSLSVSQSMFLPSSVLITIGPPDVLSGLGSTQSGIPLPLVSTLHGSSCDVPSSSVTMSGVASEISSETAINR